MNQSIKIFISVLAGSIVFLISSAYMQVPKSALLGIITLLVGLWSSEALPLGVVSLLPIVLFPSFDILSTKQTALNYGHPIIFLFIGGFLLAIAVEKTKLHIYIAQKILSIFPNTPRGMIFSLSITSALLSSILSNTTTTLLLMSLAIFLTEHEKLKMRFALSIAYGASIGGILTPIGTPPNLVLLGVMDDKGLEYIPFFKWVMIVSPLVFMMLIAVGFLLSIGTKEIKINNEPFKDKLHANQKKVLYLLGGVMILLLVNAPIRPYWDGLGLSEAGILLSSGLLLFAPPLNILKWDDDNSKIPYGIVFLFGAGFSIAKAFSATALADDLANILLSMTDFSPMILLLGVATLITFSTEITSNTALISIMLPVIYSVTVKAGLDSTLFMMVATVCASYAFMLPIATPPNAIAMSSKVVKIKDMMRYGIILNILGIICIVLAANYIWRNAI